MKKKYTFTILFLIALFGNTPNFSTANNLEKNNPIFSNTENLLKQTNQTKRKNINFQPTQNSTWQPGIGAYNNNEFQFGNFTNPNQEHAFCANQAKNAPWTTDYSHTHQGSIYQNTQKDAQANYITQKFGSNQDAFTAAATQLAVWKVEGNDETTLNSWVNKQNSFNNNELLEHANHIFTQALQYAGPYTPNTSIIYENGQNNAQLTVGLTSYTNNFVPNIPVTITLHGDAGVAFANEQKEITITTETDLKTIPFNVSASGSLEVNFNFANIPENLPLTQTPTDKDAQNLLITEENNTTTINDTLTHPPIILDFSLKVETETSTFIAEKGTKISDKLNISVTKNQWLINPQTKKPWEIPVISTLYGPFEQQPTKTQTPPNNAPKVDTTTTITTGEGTYQTNEIELPSTGFYTWVDHITPIPGVVKEWNSEFGVTEETTLVKWEPQVTTQTSNLRAEKGTQLFDTLCVTGNQPNKELTINSTLYGPFLNRPTQQTSAPENAPTAGTVQTKITGDNCAQSPTITLKEYGFYVWTENINETDTTKPWQSEFGITEETTIVPWEIFISSDISDRVAVKDGQVADTLYTIGFPGNHGSPAATNFGLPNDKAWETKPVPPIFQNPTDWHKGLHPNFGDKNTPDEIWVTADMYFVPYRPEQTPTIPTDAVLFGTQQVPAYDGQFITPNFPNFTELAGCYTVVGSFPNTDRINGFVTDFGIPSETTCTHEIPNKPGLEQPQVITKTSNETINPGNTIFDHIIISSLPTNTTINIKSTLYGPFTEKPTLSNQVPKNAPNIGTVTTTVNQNGPHKTNNLTIPENTQPNSWFVWHETIEETNTTLPWEGPFGITTEMSQTPNNPQNTTTNQNPLGNTGINNKLLPLIAITIFTQGILTFLFRKKIHTTQIKLKL